MSLVDLYMKELVMQQKLQQEYLLQQQLYSQNPLHQQHSSASHFMLPQLGLVAAPPLPLQQPMQFAASPGTAGPFAAAPFCAAKPMTVAQLGHTQNFDLLSGSSNNFSGFPQMAAAQQMFSNNNISTSSTMAHHANFGNYSFFSDLNALHAQSPSGGSLSAGSCASLESNASSPDSASCGSACAPFFGTACASATVAKLQQKLSLQKQRQQLGANLNKDNGIHRPMPIDFSEMLRDQQQRKMCQSQQQKQHQLQNCKNLTTKKDAITVGQKRPAGGEHSSATMMARKMRRTTVFVPINSAKKTIPKTTILSSTIKKTVNPERRVKEIPQFSCNKSEVAQQPSTCSSSTTSSISTKSAHPSTITDCGSIPPTLIPESTMLMASNSSATELPKLVPEVESSIGSSCTPADKDSPNALLEAEQLPSSSSSLTAATTSSAIVELLLAPPKCQVMSQMMPNISQATCSTTKCDAFGGSILHEMNIPIKSEPPSASTEERRQKFSESEAEKNVEEENVTDKEIGSEKENKKRKVAEAEADANETSLSPMQRRKRKRVPELQKIKVEQQTEMEMDTKPVKHSTTIENNSEEAEEGNTNTATPFASPRVTVSAANTVVCRWARCIKRFSDDNQLYDHLTTDHVEQLGKLALADQCEQADRLRCRWRKCEMRARRGDAQKKLDWLLSHLAIRHAPKAHPHKCLFAPHCPLRFRKLQALKDHLRSTHDDVVPKGNGRRSGTDASKLSCFEFRPRIHMPKVRDAIDGRTVEWIRRRLHVTLGGLDEVHLPEAPSANASKTQNETKMDMTEQIGRMSPTEAIQTLHKIFPTQKRLAMRM